MLSDHYQALGVAPQASHGEVRAAYLRVMRAHHPDVSQGDERSAERARRANAAWEVLGDRARRAAYDRLLDGGRHGSGVRYVSPPARVPRRPAYSPDGARYRQAFQRACQKVGAAVFVLGLVLLLAFA